MTFPEVIFTAIEGGYQGFLYHDRIRHSAGSHSVTGYNDETGESHTLTVAEILLSVDFWLGYGKGKGFGDYWDENQAQFSEEICHKRSQKLFEKFQEHIWSGGIPEEFFESL